MTSLRAPLCLAPAAVVPSLAQAHPSATAYAASDIARGVRR
ncbi:hypothetical protein [Dyella lipolytica]|nr:hypothetical protein [Dyella lipolytica]